MRITKEEARKIERKRRNTPPKVIGTTIEVRDRRVYKVVVLEDFHPGVTELTSRYSLREKYSSPWRKGKSK